MKIYEKFLNLTGALLLLVVSTNSRADDDGHPDTCHHDAQKTEDYVIDDQGEVEKVAEDSAEEVVGSIAVDMYWLKEKIKDLVPVPELLDDAMNNTMLSFRDWLKSEGSILSKEASKNAYIKYQAALKDKHPRLKGLGVYTWTEDHFSEGSWSGGDLVLDGDTGVSAAFKAEAEFNLGAAFLMSSEAKVQLVVSGSAGVQMTALSSKTQASDKGVLKVGGKPTGQAKAKSSFEIQVGFSGQTDIESTANFTQNRETVTVTANEEKGICNQ